MLNGGEDALLTYIDDPNGYARQMADRYWEEHQEEMLFQFRWNDLVQERLDQFREEGDTHLSRIRDIMQAANRTSAKTLTVTVNKEGVECTFKMASDLLKRDPGRSYYTWGMASKDKKVFEGLYGPHADYLPEEITRITYNGRTLYEAEPLGLEESQDQGPTLSM